MDTRRCKKCRTQIPAGLFSCPNCQAPYIEETVDCPACGKENSMDAEKCVQCGHVFYRRPERDAFDVHEALDDTTMEELPRTIADLFNKAFEKRLREEHHPTLHGAYIDRFYKSDFRFTAGYRIGQLAEQVSILQGEKKWVDKQRKVLSQPVFEELIDYFIIHFCRDLNEVQYPEKILKYHGPVNINSQGAEMVRDYLRFDEENEIVYFNFVEMPPNRLKNAADQFLFPQKGEILYFICDLSLLGNCKEGFAMTNECIYWKLPLEKKQRVYYKKLKTLTRQEDWILINGIFFNAGKSLNLKLLRLLNRLMYLFAELQ